MIINLIKVFFFWVLRLESQSFRRYHYLRFCPVPVVKSWTNFVLQRPAFRSYSSWLSRSRLQVGHLLIRLCCVFFISDCRSHFPSYWIIVYDQQVFHVSPIPTSSIITWLPIKLKLLHWIIHVLSDFDLVMNDLIFLFHYYFYSFLHFSFL